MAEISTTIVLAPPTVPEPAAAPTEDPATTLATLPAPDGHPHLVLLTGTGTPAVVLTHRRSSVDLLRADGTVTTVPAHTPAATITDPTQRSSTVDNLVHDSTDFHVTIDAVDEADRDLY